MKQPTVWKTVSGATPRYRAMHNSIFVKAAEVIRGCENIAQVDTAVRFVSRAGQTDSINAEEWDMLHYQCQKKTEQIINELGVPFKLLGTPS